MSTGNSSVPQNPNNSSSVVGESNEVVQVDNELQEQKVMESAGKIDMEVMRESATDWIMMHGHPFTILEEVGFNIMMKRIMPEWKPISKSTIKSDCLKVYETFGSQVSHQRSAYNWDDFDACCEQVDTSRVQRQGNWDDFDAYCEEVETSRVQRQESRTTAIFDL
nr:zinc finger BED domain-containing protein RICESLEEPER 2-like [Ipomoea batatas]